MDSWLDSWAIKYVSMSGINVIAMNALVIIAGGVLGWKTWEGERTLRRVPYLLIFAISTLMLTILQGFWSLTAEAMSKGYLTALFAASMLSFATYGYVTWIMAAARSRDLRTDGSTASAAAAFIPIANLYLIFAKSNRVRASDRSWAGRFIADPLLVIVAILVLSINRQIGKEATADMLSMPSTAQASAQTVEMTAASLGIAATVEMAAAELQGQLPMRVDEITQLTSVTADAGQLTYYYSVEEPVTLQPNFGQNLIRQMCQPDAMRPVLEAGGSMVLRYMSTSRRLLLSQTVAGRDCA